MDEKTKARQKDLARTKLDIGFPEKKAKYLKLVILGYSLVL